MSSGIARSTESASRAPAGAPGRRVCIVNEDLTGTTDDGVKKLTLALGAASAAAHDVTLVSTRRSAPLPAARLAPDSCAFIGRLLLRELRDHYPELVVYAARSSTIFSSVLPSRRG
jgi:hypothetical protein